MTTIRIDHRLSPREYAAVVDAAKLRAMQLRRDAFDEVWAGMGRAALAVWRAVRNGQSAARATRRRLNPKRSIQREAAKSRRAQCLASCQPLP